MTTSLTSCNQCSQENDEAWLNPLLRSKLVAKELLAQVKLHKKIILLLQVVALFLIGKD